VTHPVMGGSAAATVRGSTVKTTSTRVVALATSGPIF
jgi:hypothetical protein